MNREEKNLQSKNKIIESALMEFGTKNYADSSLNRICTSGNISKGIIYHYFKDKDELFLYCVNECFTKLIEHLKNWDFIEGDFSKSIHDFFYLRYSFFRDQPLYSNIFFNAVIIPPEHLIPRIKELRKELDQQSIEYIQIILTHVTLRDSISLEHAVDYFSMFQEMFNGYFQAKAYKNLEYNSLILEHELVMQKLLDIILYGIVKDNQ